MEKQSTLPIWAEVPYTLARRYLNPNQDCLSILFFLFFCFRIFILIYYCLVYKLYDILNIILLYEPHDVTLSYIANIIWWAVCVSIFVCPPMLGNFIKITWIQLSLQILQWMGWPTKFWIEVANQLPPIANNFLFAWFLLHEYTLNYIFVWRYLAFDEKRSKKRTLFCLRNKFAGKHIKDSKNISYIASIKRKKF